MLPKFRRIVTIAALLLLPLVSNADDIDIFTGSLLSVPPNILIIFDTSGSMSEDVPSSVYDPNHDYTSEVGGSGWGGSTARERYRVYAKGTGNWGGSVTWSSFASSTSALGCVDARTALDSIGHWVGYIQGVSPFACGGSNSESLATGNYLNYLDSPRTLYESKLAVAKRTIKNLLDSYDQSGVRFGLMRFNADTDRGGRIVSSIGTAPATIKSQIDVLTANGATPLAETLAEAGLYFAGKASWANPGTNYTSPITWRCQKNYIIIMTDGNSWSDQGDGNGTNIFTRDNYMDSRKIGDRDGDRADPGADNNGGTHWLDDVAKFLYDEDLILTGTDQGGGSYNDNNFSPQRVVTYTIGFATGTNDLLLKRTADSNHGHGAYYSAENAQQLEAAFSSILGDILARNSNFVAPVVPVSKLNKVYSGSSLYLGLFFPTESGIWNGNLKKYGLSTAGGVWDVNGDPAVDSSGAIGASVSSLWADVGDGPRVVEGGAGLQLIGQASRKFYTYKTGNTNKSLTDASNLFATTNANITYSLMGVSSDAVKNDLINYLRAEGVYAHGGSSAREWVMGDVIHSIPAVYPIAYDPLTGTGLSLVFVGSNDGFLHCFLDADGANNENSPPNYKDDRVTEAWSFVPWDLIPSLKKTKSSLKTDSVHEYFVDGSPTVYKLDNNLYLTIGLRRGGINYYTLKVGDFGTDGLFNVNSYQSPAFVWQLGPTVTNLSEPLGQSWGWPQFRKVKTGTGAADYANVLFISGGYDSDEDADKPNDKTSPTNVPATGDDKGRAVFAVNASNGAIALGGSPVFRFSRADGNSAMTHAIVDLVVFDSNSDGFADTAYAGDLGGNLFVMTDRDGDGDWDFRHLFRARGNTDPTGRWLKFFYAPDATLERFETGLGEYVYIGSGDRSNPGDCYTRNRFYAIKNRWLTETSESSQLPAPSSPQLPAPAESLPLTESSLTDVTAYNYSSYTFDNGWFIKLAASEKVVSRPMTFGGMVFFTTYLPDCGTSTSTDRCQGSGIGSGRLYILDHQTGKAVFNFDTSNDSDANGDGVITSEERLGASDRYVGVVGLPTAPVLIMTKSGPQILIGTSEGILKIDLPANLSVNRYYWKQV